MLRGDGDWCAPPVTPQLAGGRGLVRATSNQTTATFHDEGRLLVVVITHV